MSYGYGRNDPDNWDTDPWGRPIDPDESFDAPPKTKAPEPIGPIKDGHCVKCGEARTHDRHHPFATFTSGCCVFDDGKMTVPPMDLYGAKVACVDDGSHQYGGDSDRGACSRCGFSWRRLHTVVGSAVVGTGAVVLTVGKARTTLSVGEKVGDGT